MILDYRMIENGYWITKNGNDWIPSIVFMNGVYNTDATERDAKRKINSILQELGRPPKYDPREVGSYEEEIFTKVSRIDDEMYDIKKKVDNIPDNIASEEEVERISEGLQSVENQIVNKVDNEVFLPFKNSTEEDIEDLESNKLDTSVYTPFKSATEEFLERLEDEKVNNSVYTPFANATNNTLKSLSSIVTPLQYGAIGNGVADDIEALEAAYIAAGNLGTIDLGKKTYYISRPFRLTSQRRKIINGTIIADGNCVEPYTQYCWGNSFENVTLRSREGYAYYAKFGNGGLFEVYEDRFVDVIFEGKLGAYFARGENETSNTFYGVGFSHTFMRCTAKSSEGHGFSGVKGPGSIMIDCDNQGIPNGALFHNCSDVKIQNSDSNGQMKHGILIDKYVTTFYAEGCNFEHCSEEGVKITSGIVDVTLKNTSISRTTDPNRDVVVSYPAIINAQNIILEMFHVNNYTSKITDIYTTNTPSIRTFNSADLKITANNFYRNKVITIPKMFMGTLEVDNISNENSEFIISKEHNKRLKTNEKLFGAFVQQPLEVTSVTSNNIDFRSNPSTSFNLTSPSITTVRGIIGTYNGTLLGEGTIFTITNKTGAAINLVHNNHVSNIPLLLTSSANTSLENNNSAVFVVILIDNVKKLKQII